MRMPIVLALLCWAALIGSTLAEDPVHFADAALKAAVEDELWVWDPTPTDMLGLVDLNAASRGVAHLGGLEYATNLQTLVLRWNRLSDVSALAALVNLQYLDIHDNQIRDLTPLAGLGDLRTLVLRFNRISDISALAGLTALEHLDLRGNPLSQEAYDVHLPQIVANNPGIELKYDSYSQCLLLVSSTAGGSVLYPGEGQFVYDNGATVELEARADSGYVFVGWSGSLSGSDNPASFVMDADHNIRANFASVVDPGSSTDPVPFADAALQAAVEAALAVAGPTPADMLALTELTCARQGITSLAGIEYAANLRQLDLAGNDIGDISPLSALTSLESLDLRGNPLSQQTYDVYISLVLANNPGIDLKYDTPARHQVSIRATPGGTVTQPGEGSFTYDHGQTVLLRARPDPGFAFVRWSGSYQGDANPVYLKIYQDHAVEAVFAATFETLYIDDDARGDPAGGDPNVSDPTEDGTSEHPFDTIQEAIDVATDGATLIVRPGTYRETVSLRGKNILLTGLDPNGGPLPVLDGGGRGPVVSFTGGEDPNCMLVGFVITGGRHQQASAIVCAASSPVVANCLIVGNRATSAQGAAIRCQNSDATFTNCTIADNIGSAAMLIDSHTLLTNSIVWGDIALAGVSKPSITYSDLPGGWPDTGNMDTDPLFVRRGYWTEPDDPNAVWVAGDYHLRSQAGRWDSQERTWLVDDVTSPGVDAGDPAAPVGSEPAPNGGRINIGAYGGTPHGSKSKLRP